MEQICKKKLKVFCSQRISLDSQLPRYFVRRNIFCWLTVLIYENIFDLHPWLEICLWVSCWPRIRMCMNKALDHTSRRQIQSLTFPNTRKPQLLSTLPMGKQLENMSWTSPFSNGRWNLTTFHGICIRPFDMWVSPLQGNQRLASKVYF